MTGSDNVESIEAQAADEHKRFRSEIEFPYADLENAVQLAQILHEKGGNSCETEELAVWMGQSASGGTFRSRLNEGRIFGLIETAQGRATLTPLGRESLENSANNRSARVNAFLNAELFRALYEQNKGHPLPPQPALERQIEQLGVSPKQKIRARQIFMNSAEYAGFIDQASGKFVKPGVGGAKEEKPDGGKGCSGGGGDPPEIDPIIQGLLARLPKSGEIWPKAQRKLWLQLLEGSFDLIYKDEAAN